ncbi:hypothetical protein, partial [Actinobacillus pleuropneumoniae]|uniref:hypothetical protein n=1 Tax=Actinobacillus pleuropneumoniae TaxID=715 RepID=UPI00227D22B7
FVISTTVPVVSQTVTQPIPINPISTPPLRPHVVQPNMVVRYAPLVLLGKLHPLPQDFQIRISQFDVTIVVSGQQHIDKMNDSF